MASPVVHQFFLRKGRRNVPRWNLKIFLLTIVVKFSSVNLIEVAGTVNSSVTINDQSTEPQVETSLYSIKAGSDGSISENDHPSGEISNVPVPDEKSNTSNSENTNATRMIHRSNKCDVIPQSEPKSASLMLVYIIIFIYSFLGIIVTCHKYFVTSMSRICEDLKLSEDIVGATFMAAGSSAPELATVIIAVFFTEDDIGISDVIGSAVFNMLFVIALCGLFTTTALRLNWWPLVRNCFFYTISILIMLVAIANKEVSWPESILLIGIYVVYCLSLYYNEILEAWANTLPLPFNKLQNEDVKEMDANYIPLEDRRTSGSTYAPTTERKSIIQENGKIINSIQQTYKTGQDTEKGLNTNSGLTLPANSGILEQMKFYFINPVYYVCMYTIPDYQEDRFRDLYFLTFFVSFVWISIYSYIMIWMITIIGEIIGIPSTVMGLTLVAAGVSVPDAVTSLKVIKEGHADMAVSNAIGSNIFDILVCLGIPWFLKTAIVSRGSYVTVCSKGMIDSTLLLLSTVILLITALHKNEWKLDKKFGVVLMIGYVIFITFAVVVELMRPNIRCGCDFL